MVLLPLHPQVLRSGLETLCLAEIFSPLSLFETETHCSPVWPGTRRPDQAGFELAGILLPLLPEFWDYSAPGRFFLLNGPVNKPPTLQSGLCVTGHPPSLARPASSHLSRVVMLNKAQT